MLETPGTPEKNDLICYCLFCGGQVLFEDVKSPNADREGSHLVADKLYCPRCEMLVDPIVTPVTVHGEHHQAARPDAPENTGRSRTGGSNAGGSQRGDLSDEGATQRLRDPNEAESNAWRDKT